MYTQQLQFIKMKKTYFHGNRGAQPMSSKLNAIQE